MRVFIARGTDQFTSNEICTESTYAAFYGFSLMGAEIVFFDAKDGPPDGLSREDIVVGWIENVKKGLMNLGIEPPLELDYPESLLPYLGRNIWESTLHKIYTDPTTWPVFVKPKLGKQFTGKLVTSLKDMIGLGSRDDRAIWCSDPMDFTSEWRTFVRYGQMLDSRCYKGDFRVSPNWQLVQEIIEAYTDQPSAFTLDIGPVLQADGSYKTHIIEVNDGYAMGGYGLFPTQYAKMISARWCQMVGIPDLIQF